MSLNCASSSSETSPAADQPASLPAPSKASRKRIYAVLGIVAVAAVTLALVFAFLIPPNVEATIPLIYNYTPGEEMTYNLTGTTTNTTGQNTSLTETMSMDILSFDGENYTINQTMTLSIPGGSPMSFSVTQKINKTGYVTNLNGTAEIQQAYSSFPGFGSSSWQKDEAKVGETWQIPLSLDNITYAVFNGNLTLKFGDIQDITVAAGVYRVFRIDVSGSNLSMAISTPPPANASIFENFTISGQTYLEYGTCRLVTSDFQESISMLQGTQISAQNITMHMELVKHIRP